MKIAKSSYIHPSVEIPNDLIIGEKSRIFDNTVLAGDVIIGDNCTIGKLCNFEPNVRIGNNVGIHSQSHLTTGLVIEDYVWIGPMFLGLNTKKIKGARDFPFIRKAPTIKRGARIGARVTLMPAVVIGKEAVIDACAVVTKDVPAREIWRGFPARKIGDVSVQDLLV